MNRHVLLIEDDVDIAELISLHLADIDAAVTHSDDGVRGLTLALQDRWDLILLDLTLPRCDGLAICEQVRQCNPGTPLILVTARTSEIDRVRGLDTGADDYITKPFSILELMARVKALLRRVDTHGEAVRRDIVASGSIVMNRSSHSVTVAGRNASLTPREFDLLMLFAESPGQVFKRTELLEKVWGHTHSGYLHTVNSHINRLRSKIEPDSAKPRYITTVWGVGYKLVP